MSADNGKKILFIRIWSSPPIAASVENMLRDSFPEYELEIVSVGKVLKRKFVFMALNVLAVLKEYGGAILAGHHEFKVAFWGTTYLFRRGRNILTKRYERDVGQYVFSFQLQSLMDCSIPGLPHYVYTDHTALENLNYPGFDRRKLYTNSWIALENQIYQNANLVFTRSTNISRSIVQTYGCVHERVIQVYAGANASVPVRRLEESRYAAKNILFVGVDWERKGGPLLVEAFKRIRGSHPEATLTIVGPDLDLDVPNCVVAGYVPVDQLAAYYEGASVFCMPTRLEPFGAVIPEAMAYSLPIISTKVGAIPDMVQPDVNGILIEPDDLDGLTDALLDLLGDSEKCHRYGENAYALYADRYNWNKVGGLVRQHILSDLGAS